LVATKKCGKRRFLWIAAYGPAIIGFCAGVAISFQFSVSSFQLSETPSDEIGVAPESPGSAGPPPVDRKRVAGARDGLAVFGGDADLEPGARKCEIVADLNFAYVGADVEVHLFDVFMISRPFRGL